MFKQPFKGMDFSHKKALKILFTHFNTTFKGLNLGQSYQ